MPLDLTKMPDPHWPEAQDALQTVRTHKGTIVTIDDASGALAVQFMGGDAECHASRFVELTRACDGISTDKLNKLNGKQWQLLRNLLENSHGSD